MDKLLDKEVHQLYKAPSLVNYLGSKSSGHPSTSSSTNNHPSHVSSTQNGHHHSDLTASQAGKPVTSSSVVQQSPTALLSQGTSAEGSSQIHPRPGPSTATGSGARPKLMYPLRYNSGKDTDSSAVEEEDELKALEAKLRCMSMKKKPSQGNFTFIGVQF